MSAAVSRPLRLAAIRICSYRGFPHPVEIKLAAPGGHGRSLLLYGENGSGKSSIGKAIRDFLDLRSGAVSFDDFKYRHANPPDPQRAIKLLFDDPALSNLEWKPAGRDTTHSQFKDMARARGWLDYRVVWRASDVQFGDSIDVFRQLIEEILPSCQRGVSNETFGQTWEKIHELADKNPRLFGRERALVSQLRELLKQFNDSLNGFLPELEKQANEFLAEFAPWTSMEIKSARDCHYDTAAHSRKFSDGSVRLRMRDRDGNPLNKPSEFLNEARVTAIGLCLYLAGMARSVPPKRSDGSTYPRLLVLDDVLLSLDMAHRLPLLRVLREHFKNWQVLLLTHDRAWYEIAKQQLEGWAHHELFCIRVGDYEQPILREDQDHLYWALQFLQDGHVKAAAVHVRTKFELILKWACELLGVPVKYRQESHKIPASDFWAAVKSAKISITPPPCFKNVKGKVIWYQLKAIEQRIVPLALEKRIEHAVSWVLNPLSHSQTVDRYRSEIEDAIFALDELESAIKSAIAYETAGPVMLREMLLRILELKSQSLVASSTTAVTPLALPTLPPLIPSPPHT